MTAENAPPIVHDNQPRIEVGVIAEHRFHDVVVERVVFEERVIGLEEDERAVFILRILGAVTL